VEAATNRKGAAEIAAKHDYVVIFIRTPFMAHNLEITTVNAFRFAEAATPVGLSNAEIDSTQN
jgi:hypothetical protein